MEFDKFAGSEFERRSAAKAALKGRVAGRPRNPGASTNNHNKNN
jgi:hypothetical protein